MTNFEFYKDKIIVKTIEEFAIDRTNGEIVDCSASVCPKCFFRNEVLKCPETKTKWLYGEYKPIKPAKKLTKEEFYFLKGFEGIKGIEFIRVNKDTLDVWHDEYVPINPNYFRFIHNGEKWTLEDLLKLEVMY